jgi:hypothetical protein
MRLKRGVPAAEAQEGSVGNSDSTPRLDWIPTSLPIALSLAVYSGTAQLLMLGILAATAFLRPATSQLTIKAGPLILFVTSAGIVLFRPEGKVFLISFILVVLIATKLASTVRAQVVIRSLIVGLGIYLTINLVAHLAGIRPRGAGDRVGGWSDAAGYSRVFFPFSTALDVVPTVASAAIVGSVILAAYSKSARWRLAYLGFAIVAALVIWMSATRTALLITAVISVSLLLLAPVSNWIAQAATVLAVISAVLLPPVMSLVQNFVSQVLSLVGTRYSSAAEVASLNSRDEIWSGLIGYWINFVDATARVVGFGQGSQYKSGAWLTYPDGMAEIVRNPEHASMHNSFLQQLYDGGIAGWLLMAVALYMTSVRLVHRRPEWGAEGLAGIGVFTALLLNATTQITIAPGGVQIGFWIVLVLIAVSSQEPSPNFDPRKPAKTITATALKSSSF